VWQVPGEPEQLQLEGEDERIGSRAARAGLELVEEVEEACQRPERALVRLLLREEAQHRLGADEAGIQAIRVLTGGMVRAEELRTGDRLELAATLAQA